MKKLISSLLATAIVLSSAAGCSNQPSESGSKDKDSSGKVTLEILSLKQEQQCQDAFNKMFDQYKKKNPNVSFDLQSMSSDNLKTTLRTRIASDDMPDIVTWMKEIEVDNLVDLSKESFMKNLDENSVAGANAIYKDAQYAMPVDNGYIGMYYNKTVLSQNGLEVPKTLSALEDACKKLKAKGITPFATGAKDLSVPYMGLIALFSETVYGQNPTWSADRDANKTTIANDKNWKLAFDLQKKYIYGYSDVNNAFNISYDDANGKLAQGKAAFYVNGSWALSGIRTANKDADIGLAPVPFSENEKDAKLLYFPDTSLSVCKASKNADAAKAFLGYVASQDAGKIWSENVSVSSAVKGADVNYDPIAADIKSYVDAKQTNPYGDRVLRTVFTDKMWEDYSKYMLGTMDWAALSKELDTYWDKARDAAK